jgi:delta 1-pyrroline-5-carboxylate dehydrogenase
VGNLYFNRGCTGAIVERQPFGGFKMSGIGSKAGGPDYLLQFMEPRTVTENTMRRGFVPLRSKDEWIEQKQDMIYARDLLTPNTLIKENRQKSNQRNRSIKPNIV